MNLDITTEHRKIVVDILNRYLHKGSNVWVFGSRATMTAKKASDLDLAIDQNGKKIHLSQASQLAEAFDESALPYKVDVVDLNAITDEFKHIIDQQKKPLNLVNKN